MVQVNAKVERVSSKKLDEVLSHKKSFSNRTGLGYPGKTSSTVNITKEVKFVKAKEPMVATTKAEKVKPEKKRNVTDQWVLNKPHNQSVVRLKPKGNHFQSHKKVREHNTSAITVDFKDTPNQIVIILEHWKMQVIRGQEDQEMTKGIALLNNQEA